MRIPQLLLGVTFLVSWTTAAAILPAGYDVVWTTPSQVNGSANSMPVGGGDIGCNVWVENGTVLFYIAKSGTFDENSSMLKLGRVRLTLDPNPFALGAESFEQRLVLEDGYIRLTGADGAVVLIWVDVHSPVIHVELNSTGKINLQASLESWRYEDHLMETLEQKQSSWQGIPSINATTYKDSIDFYRHGVLSSHRNKDITVFDATVKQQKLEKYQHGMYNPLKANTFGLWMFGDGLSPAGVTNGSYVARDYKSWNLKSTEARTSFSLTVALYQNQTSSLDVWKSQLETIATSASSDPSDTIEWWHNFWNQSHIFINTHLGPSDPSFQVGKNYQLMRYTLGCNYYGEWPTRFNGGLFTYDPVFVADSTYDYSADFRLWSGGTFTAQNQRLVYWPMLKSGDFGMMKAEFDFYKRITATAQLRGHEYVGINHTWFTEQIDTFGLPQYNEYYADTFIFNRTVPGIFPTGLQFNDWLTWLQDTALEFVQMLLDAYQFSGYDVAPYMQFMENQLMWFDTFYQQQQQMRDSFPLTGTHGNETLVIYPGSACETYKGAYNPASTISGLRAVLTRLLQVNPAYELGNKTYYTSYLSRLPATPLRIQQGHITIAPAEAYVRIQNVEIPQLYPVFPWAEYGLGMPNLSYAIDTYLYDTETQGFHSAEGWKQDAIWTARMGLTTMAQNLTTLKLQDSKTARFPTFWGPNFDWSPDMNNGGSGMLALQEMLLQTYANESRSLRLLGAWPSNWTADFKLHAPFETTIEGRVEAGNVLGLTVTPEGRSGDVVFGGGEEMGGGGAVCGGNLTLA